MSGKVFRQKLIRDVRKLYEMDRSALSLQDTSIFKLPIRYRLKQGNQHLLLWTKRAQLTFEHYTEEAIDTSQQSRITEWLQQ